MTFNQLNYNEELGTGIGATLKDYGCAETDVASVLVNCFGKQTDPHQLNQDLIRVGGYASNGAGAYDILAWSAVTQIYSDVTVAFNNSYPSSPADMKLIDYQLNKGCSVIVGVSFAHDPSATSASHYVEIYKKNPDSTYQCRDPWGGLDIVFDSKYAVNGMSVPQCILQAVSYNGPVSQPQDAQQIEDALRTARDTNWNLYQTQLQANAQLRQQLADTQTQLTDCQTKLTAQPAPEAAVTPTPTTAETTTTEIPVIATTTGGEGTVVNLAVTTPKAPDSPDTPQMPTSQPKQSVLDKVLDWFFNLIGLK